jgi:hypothetical protein
MILRRRTLSFALLIPLLTACASTAPPPDSEGPRRGAWMGAGDELSMLSLPASWWHDAQLAEPLHLTGEQFQRLDVLAPQQAEILRIERDSGIALRELRSSLDANHAIAADIVAAGSHLRDMRRNVLEQQIAMLAAQREILTADQWRLLQRVLAEERRPARRENGQGRGRGEGRGRGPGGGRRPRG